VDIRVGLPGTAIVTVRDKDGSPLTEAGVTLTPLSAEPAWFRREQRSTRITGVEGIARFTGLARARLSLAVTRDGFQDHRETIAVSEAPLHATIELERKVTIHGAVVDRYGAPVEHARVHVPGLTTATGPRGRFQAVLSSKEPVRIVAVHTELGRGEVTWNPSDSDLRVELNAPTIDVGRWRDLLESGGLTLWVDGQRVVVEDVSEDAHAAGVRRGDVLIDVRETRSGASIEVDRNGRTVRLSW
jgi:hypothetical protein